MESFVVRAGEGDSVLSLCRRFSVPMERLIAENRLTGEIAEGELVYISRPCRFVHIAEAGETYASIAERFKKSEESLRALNRAEYVFYAMPVVIEE